MSKNNDETLSSNSWMKKQPVYIFGFLNGEGVEGGGGEEEGRGWWGTGQWLSDFSSFYLVRLPVEGGTTIIEPVSFVLRLLADLVLFSGDASFLWKTHDTMLIEMYVQHLWIFLHTCTLTSSSI